MDKEVLSAIGRGDEAEALLAVEKLDRSLRGHFGECFESSKGVRCVKDYLLSLRPRSQGNYGPSIIALSSSVPQSSCLIFGTRTRHALCCRNGLVKALWL